MRRRVYRAERAMPEIGAEPGDHIIVRPGVAKAPLMVVKRYGHHDLVKLMGSGALDGMEPIHVADSQPVTYVAPRLMS